MTTIRQLIQTSPIRANELLTKLADTSDTALKTRDRLLLELKVELSHQAELEEKYLFPVLKKHKRTKRLVTDALKDNRETRKLLTELERTPRDSEEFSLKVAELKKNFQKHVHDDKKYFLPAVVKSLSDEETRTVIAKIDDQNARIEEAKLAEVKERRDEAKREYEKVEMATDLKGTTESDAERDQPDMDAPELKATDKTSAGISIVSMLNEQARNMLQATLAVGRARTLVEISRVQSDFMGNSLQRMGEFNQRYFVFISGGMAAAYFAPSYRG